MTMTALEVWDYLRSSFLLPLERIQDWPLAPGPDEDRTAFLDRLTQGGWLTPYQKQQLLDGQLRDLLLGNYRLLGEVEHGPEGRVFQAEHLFLRQPVLIRVLGQGPLLQRPGLANWLAQVSSISRWNHPVIVGIVDAGIYPSPPGEGTSGFYFVSPFISGTDLRELVLDRGPLPLETACQIAYQVCHAIAEAHARNLAHGSLSPSSVRRTPEGQVKLVDFALKTWPRESFSLPAKRLHPQEPGAARGDLVGLAHCLYWSLIGQEPRQAKSGLKPDPLPPLRDLRPEVPPEVDYLVISLLTEAQRGSWSPQRIRETLLPFIGSPPGASQVEGGRSEADRAYPPTLVLPPRPGMTLPSLIPPVPSEKAGRSILIVDDEPSIRNLCRLTLTRIGMHAEEAADGLLALKAIANHHYDLVLLDIDMPGMDGLEVCRRLRRIPDRPHLKVLLFSGRVEGDTMAPMLLAGADDFLTKPFTTIQLQNRVLAALRLKQAQERSDLLYRDLLILNREMEQHLHERDSDLVTARNALVRALASLAEYRDTDTGDHLRRIEFFTTRLAEEAMGHPAFAGQLDRNYLDLLAGCAPLHDIGKVGLPDAVLRKPGKLTEEERLHMQKHTTIGAETLEKVARENGFAMAFLQMSIDITRHHHERFDGTGYPDRLVGTEIPLSARIVAVCDVYDAMRSRRVYKPALSHATVVDIIRQGSASHFDPNLVNCFDQCEQDFERIYEKMKD